MTELAIGAIMFVLIGLTLTLIVGWGKFVEWLERVNSNAPVIMSRAQVDAPEISPSSLQTDSRQTADRPMMPIPTRDEMLDACKALRKRGWSRDEARALLRTLGHPLDNNLWAAAAPPPEEPQTVTPIAQRPTNAQFHEDPELAYHPPPH